MPSDLEKAEKLTGIEPKYEPMFGEKPRKQLKRLAHLSSEEILRRLKDPKIVAAMSDATLIKLYTDVAKIGIILERKAPEQQGTQNVQNNIIAILDSSAGLPVERRLELLRTAFTALQKQDVDLDLYRPDIEALIGRVNTNKLLAIEGEINGDEKEVYAGAGRRKDTSQESGKETPRKTSDQTSPQDKQTQEND